jgi:hypothetical protein
LISLPHSSFHDCQQLPPIIKGNYPVQQQGELKHYGSILECLLRDTAEVRQVRPFGSEVVGDDSVNVQQTLCTKLRENNRMNLSLAGFTQFTYGTDYQSQHPQRRLGINANQVAAVVLQGPPQQQTVLRNAISMDASINVINITVETQAAAMTREDMAQIEASMVRDIFTLFSVLNNEQDPEKVAEQMIVVTPNHIQRRAVKQLLGAIPEARSVLVNTVEVAQGKTADLVVLCYGIFSQPELERNCDFLLTPSRLNVSLSRARAKVIVLVGDCLIDVPAKFIRDKRAQQGYKLFLHAIQHSRSEHGYQELQIQ